MLDAKDFELIDLVLPFIGAIADRLCGICEGLTTLSFVRCVEPLQLFIRYRRPPGWSLEKSRPLRRVMKEFQKASACAFMNYQFSGTLPSKWHALNHLADNIEDVGCIEVLHGGKYESAHKKFKVLYLLTIKCRIEAFQETIQLHNKHDRIHNLNDGQVAVRNANL